MKELKNVVIYTKDHCPFSKRVKEYLTSEKVDFKQIRVDDDPKTYDELKRKNKSPNCTASFCGWRIHW